MSNKRRRNDIEEITEQRAYTILDVLDDFPILSKSLQAIAALRNDDVVFTRDIVTKINNNPTAFYDYVAQKLIDNINLFFSDLSYRLLIFFLSFIIFPICFKLHRPIAV